MNLEIKRIKDTPYKLVLIKHEVIGIFDHGKYISRSFLSDKLKHLVAQHHASSLLERLEDTDGD